MEKKMGTAVQASGSRDITPNGESNGNAGKCSATWGHAAIQSFIVLVMWSLYRCWLPFGCT